jgi:hypothetical protein
LWESVWERVSIDDLVFKQFCGRDRGGSDSRRIVDLVFR